MRKIKFRVWDKRKNKGTQTKKMLYDAQHHPLWFDFLDYPEIYELMQFTGLLDKDNKEIYEGDILEELTNNKSEKEIGVCKLILGGWRVFNINSDICFLAGKGKIIGNKFENPELLTKL